MTKHYADHIQMVVAGEVVESTQPECRPEDRPVVRVLDTSDPETARCELLVGNRLDPMPWADIWKKGEAKGTQLREGLRDGELALLVDDSVAELAHPTVALRTDVHRVLFVRAVL